MEEKQYGDYFLNNYSPKNLNQRNENNKDENSNKFSNLDIPSYKALACVCMGWLGISIVATIFSLVVGLFIEIPAEGTTEYLKLNGWLQIVCYSVTLITLLVILGKKILIKLLHQFKKFSSITKGIMYGFLLISASIAYNLIALAIYPDFGSNQNQNSVVDMIITTPIISFISVVFLAPVTEEITYRLCLTGELAKKSKIIGIIVSSLLFGLIHSAFFNLSFLDMDKQQIINEIVALPSYIISGLIMAIAYVKEDSIACSITAHMTNNFIAFVQAFLAEELIESAIRLL